MTIRTYRELRRLRTLEERYDYLRVNAKVGVPTFGDERYLNQRFYTSREWRRVRHEVIARDMGCDLGVEDYELHDKIYIHHMNPMTVEEIRDGSDRIFDPEYLICASLRTHNAIHYGDASLLVKPFVERTPGDTRLW